MQFRPEPALYTPSNLDSFYDIAPFDPNAAEKSRLQLKNQEFPRSEIDKLLYSYNESIGNPIPTLNKEQSFVVTGQQLGFMGGPSYMILKAMSVLALAKKLNAIPLFWLATEDHDILEIDHTYLVSNAGNLQKFKIPLIERGRFVEDLQIPLESEAVIRDFCKQTGFECPIDQSYSLTMARFLASLFKGTGLVFCEPKLFRSLARSFFEKEIADQDQIRECLLKTTAELIASGGKAPLVVSKGTNLFYKNDQGHRVKVSEERDFDRFSTNVFARPVLQAKLIPTLAYIAGPSEMEYYRQLKNYFHLHQIKMPWIVPRISATFISKKVEQGLDALGLNPWDKMPKRWAEAIAGIDKIPELHLPNKARKTALRKTIHSRLQEKNIPTSTLGLLQNSLFPHQKLQERMLNFCQFGVHPFIPDWDLHQSGHYYFWTGQ